MAEKEEEKAEEKAEEKVEEKPVEKKNKVTARERIAQLTRGRGDAEREADRLRQENEELKKNQRLEKKPDQGDFENFDDFSKQNTRWDNQQQQDKDTEINQRADQVIAQRQMEQAQMERSTKWAGHKSEAVTKYENFQDSEDYVVAVANHYRNPGIQELILDAKDPAAIVDYLGNNHKEAEKLAQVSLVSAARTITDLETQLKTSVKEEVKLPPPTDNAGASGSGVFDPNKATQAEYNAYYNGS